MDNYTLLSALVITVGVNAVLTYIISGKVDNNVGIRWRISSISFFIAALLILLQVHVNHWISLILGNFLYVLSVYFQISTVLHFEKKPLPSEYKLLSLIVLIYFSTFFYYTIVDFNTYARIIVVSFLLFSLYLLSILYIIFSKGTIKNLSSKYVWHLFSISCCFYFLRTVATVIEHSNGESVNSLLDVNIITSVTFIFLICHSAIFLGGMFDSNLKERNNMINQEKIRLGYLFDFLNDTAKNLEINSLYKSIESVLRKSFGIPSGAIYLVHEGEVNRLELSYSFNDLNLPIDEVITFNDESRVSTQSVNLDQVVVSNIDSHPDIKVKEEYKSKGVAYIISMPLKASNNMIGAISVAYTSKSIESEFIDKNFLMYLGEQIALVLHNSMLYEQVNEMANTDFLTGIYNRRKVQELFGIEQKRIKRNEEKLSVALIDIDHFKLINDKYGHDVGDTILKNIASILKSQFRETDYICRWGGEEFLIILNNTPIEQAKTITERVRKVFNDMTFSCIGDSSVTVSIGLAELHDYSENLNSLTAKADKALYEAKNSGRNKVCRYYQV